jgi:hypothetical protein
LLLITGYYFEMMAREVAELSPALAGKLADGTTMDELVSLVSRQYGEKHDGEVEPALGTEWE